MRIMTISKKLVLKKETIAHLAKGDMRRLQGGAAYETGDGDLTRPNSMCPIDTCSCVDCMAGRGPA